MNNAVFIGKREQPDYFDFNRQLGILSDFKDLSLLSDKYNTQQIERIEMIDVIFISEKGKSIKCIFEVENSTGFTSAIQRGSNTEKDIPKFMVIPAEREQELKRIRDPLFVKSFKNNNWHYIVFDDIERLSHYSKPSIDEVMNIAKEL